MKLRASKGFSLIEVLVVIAVLAISGGLLGIGLQSAESAEVGSQLLAGLLEAARCKAVMTQSRTTLVVSADPAGVGFLRHVRIAIETAPNSGKWNVGAAGVLLPSGTFVVPPDGTLNSSEVATASEAWPTAPRSTLRLADVDEIIALDGGGRWLVMTVPFEESATTGSIEEVRWVVAAGQRGIGGVSFKDPGTIRGVVLGAYGIAIAVNEPGAFEL